MPLLREKDLHLQPLEYESNALLLAPSRDMPSYLTTEGMWILFFAL